MCAARIAVIGETLDKYEVLQKIGEGGMATVYRGRHATLHRDVAIKVLHPHLSSSTRNRLRFEREARAIEHLDHPNILAIHDYSGVRTGDCYIVTELVDGETLTEVMARCRRLPSEAVITLGMHLADALAYAHRQGVLHRDLKPDNVMLRRDGVVKLMDFGIARFLDESQLTLTGALVGSPAFMSPEQAREEPLDARSDLFSLGTLLFFLVTGHLPFSGSNPSLILKKIIEGDRPQAAELVPAMSPGLADVIERLLAVPRDERFDDAASVRDALAASLAEIDFDPDEPRWSLARLLDDPDAWEHELEVFLTDRLMSRGRALLDAGHPLAGLRLLNRLLSMDDQHAEALELVQGLHGLGESGDGRRWAAWSAAAVSVVVLLLVWAWWAAGELPTPPAEVPAPVAEPAPVAATDVAALTPPPPDSDDGVAEVEADPPEPRPRIRAASPVAAQPALDRPRQPRVVREAPDAEPTAASAPRGGSEASEPDEAPPDAEGLGGSADDTPACIGLRSREAPADVYLDGTTKIGNTRERGCYPIAPGTHRFVLRGAMTREAEVEVTLEPGETRDPHWVALERLPVRVKFSPAHDDGCTVLLDGRPQGTLGTLGRVLSLPQPQEPHTVELQCRRERLVQRYDGIPYPDVTFAGTAP